VKIPLSAYLTEKPENLKVFILTAELCVTPIDIDIGAFVKKYGFDPSYDRFRYWVTIARFESKHEIEPEPISPLIPVRLTIRRLNFQDDWLLYAHISSDGFIEILCNDNELARKFYEDVLAHFRAPEDTSPISELDSKWTNDPHVVTAYLAGGIAGGLGEYFGKVGKKSSKQTELHSAYTRFISKLFKEEMHTRVNKG
jgi:hypothetical protein